MVMGCAISTAWTNPAEVAKLAKAMIGSGWNAPAEVYPGCPGSVVADGELRSMVCGYRLVMKSRPCNNTRAGKLDSFMWRDSLQERRCLTPTRPLLSRMLLV